MVAACRGDLRRIAGVSLDGPPRWLQWLAKVHDYTFAHFPDRRYGGWFGYLDRRGNVTNDCKGNNYLACYHVVRA